MDRFADGSLECEGAWWMCRVEHFSWFLSVQSQSQKTQQLHFAPILHAKPSLKLILAVSFPLLS